MDTIISRLIAILTLCIGANTAADQVIQPNEMRHYDVSLQPGQHLIITNSPTRRVIRVDNKRHQTLSVATTPSMAVPFVHLKIEKPTISPPPLDLVRSL
jgi:hypothetical protein